MFAPMFETQFAKAQNGEQEGGRVRIGGDWNTVVNGVPSVNAPLLPPGLGVTELPDSMSNTTIRVGIVEDDSTMRENLSELINGTPNLRCVARCSSAEEAEELLRVIKPQVVLMDINLPRKNGIYCVTKLRSQLPKTQFIMLTIEEDADQVFESLKAGATGYLVKHTPAQEILDAIIEVNSGGSPMSSHIARKVVTAFNKPTRSDQPDIGLTPRENDVLRLLAKGHRSKEIGDEMGVTAGTVNTHVRNIYEKLHVRSRAEAVAKYLGQTN
jgi:DNA-binding NarL/FixJ family response regulator